jgi:glutaredoxin
MTSRTRTGRQALAQWGLLGACAMAAGMVSAQGVYRSVGADGRITFSDQPPPSAKQAMPLPAPVGSSASGSLSADLRKAMERFPVTLYTGPDCPPCVSGRNLLHSRGIPYTEKTVESSLDIDALRRISGSPNVPLLTIGTQQLKGYADVEWTQYLDAAGYPKQSALPVGYRRPAPTALVETKPLPAAKGPSAGTDKPADIPVVAPSNAPGGIRF